MITKHLWVGDLLAQPLYKRIKFTEYCRYQERTKLDRNHGFVPEIHRNLQQK